MGENANQILDCYKVNLLLSVKQKEKIDECLQIEVGKELFMVKVLELSFQVAGGSEGIKVHCQDPIRVIEDSSSEVSGMSPASKGTNLCSKEDEEAEEWYKGNFSYIGEMEKDGRFLGEEDLAGSAQQVLMSEQNCGQNGNFGVKNNGSVQVSKKDGAVEDMNSEKVIVTDNILPHKVVLGVDISGIPLDQSGMGPVNLNKTEVMIVA
ncbi:hypothetical protein V6N13_117904 [Hibiscus sabdariffa]